MPRSATKLRPPLSAPPLSRGGQGGRQGGGGGACARQRATQSRPVVPIVASQVSCEYRRRPSATECLHAQQESHPFRASIFTTLTDRWPDLRLSLSHRRQTHSSSVSSHLLNSMGGSSTGSTSSSSPSSLQAARKVRVASLAEYLTCGPALAPVREPQGQASSHTSPNQDCIC